MHLLLDTFVGLALFFVRKKNQMHQVYEWYLRTKWLTMKENVSLLRHGLAFNGMQDQILIVVPFLFTAYVRLYYGD